MCLIGTRCSHALRAPDASAARSPCEAVRCRAGAELTKTKPGPGSAKRHEECRIAPGTRRRLPALCRNVGSRFPSQQQKTWEEIMTTPLTFPGREGRGSGLD